mmetsp:Transcript_31572/g.103167  ORF Transcript_31572/g.103167 Transcript_31572/m.103167 type:complete len:95 (+) Transcript_31572:125-409(+)
MHRKLGQRVLLLRPLHLHCHRRGRVSHRRDAPPCLVPNRLSVGGHPLGIILLKMGPFLVLAVYTEPTCATEAIPYVHRSVDDLAAAMSMQPPGV